MYDVRKSAKIQGLSEMLRMYDLLESKGQGAQEELESGVQADCLREQQEVERQSSGEVERVQRTVQLEHISESIHRKEKSK